MKISSPIVRSYKSWKRNRKILREKPELWHFETAGFGYIQIPKVATRSIQLCLANYYVEQEKMSKSLEWRKKAIRVIEDKTAFHATQKKIFKISKNTFIFAFVRNPYERLYSAYKNKVLQPLESGAKNILINHGVTLGVSFEEFVDIVCNIPDKSIDRHLRSQSWFLTFEGNLIPSYIGRLESFDEDWKVLSNRFGLPAPMHKNSTKKSKNSLVLEGFSSELQEKVYKRYEQDFLMFNYRTHL